MNRAGLLSVVCTLLLSLPAYAELRGVVLYERGDYARARKVLTEELKSSKLSPQEQAKARLYLAATLFALGTEGSARFQLEELALTAPTFKVDPILFPPDFVALAEEARAYVEAQRKDTERQRLEAEHQRLEAERRAREEAERRAREEAEAHAKQQLPPAPDTENAESRPMQLRPEVFGFIDPIGKGAGVGGAVTLGFGMLDLNARVLMGAETGMGAEVGFLLGSGTIQPRLALRGTAVPGLSAFGGGAVAGLRLASSSRLTFLVDVGAEYVKPGSDYETSYRSFVLTSSAGVGFELF